ncbi:helix-turn-helix domain-containing protein [Paenibacillus larvae]|nr:helix-turn-helix domain-containing protein [Paenibacillus larvae]MDT2238687.1 helix-turn-helix domain-containing protein [Paenibacillus larvae]
MYERYQAIYLHLKGTSMKRSLTFLNRNRMTVSSYVHTYENGGLGALQIKHSSGAPTRLTKQQDRLKQTVAYSVPHEVGFTAKHNWTLELIATYVEREWGHLLFRSRHFQGHGAARGSTLETDLHARSSRSEATPFHRNDLS